jgi:hypothetical protein
MLFKAMIAMMLPKVLTILLSYTRKPATDNRQYETIRVSNLVPGTAAEPLIRCQTLRLRNFLQKGSFHPASNVFIFDSNFRRTLKNALKSSNCACRSPGF